MNIRRKFVLIAAAIFSVITLAALAFNTNFLKARNSDECFACHEDKSLTMDKNGRKSRYSSTRVSIKNPHTADLIARTVTRVTIPKNCLIIPRNKKSIARPVTIK